MEPKKETLDEKLAPKPDCKKCKGTGIVEKDKNKSIDLDENNENIMENKEKYLLILIHEYIKNIKKRIKKIF